MVGQAESYAHCCAIKKNGKRCNAFVLRGRTDGVCSKHLEMAFATRQRSRMELATAYVFYTDMRTSSFTTRPTNMPRTFQGERPSKRVFTRSDLSGLDVGGTSLAGATYVVSSAQAPQHPSDPSSQMFDITTKLGRGKEQKEQRKRKMEEQEHLPFKRMDASQKTRKHSPHESSFSKVAHLGDDIDKKFLASVDQNSMAAKALGIAQATLRGESANSRNNRARSTTSMTMGENDATARVCMLCLFASYSQGIQHGLRHYLKQIYAVQGIRQKSWTRENLVPQLSCQDPNKRSNFIRMWMTISS